eukprot:TRINITY_DN9702_c0_g1_i1.p1 TRINITY_DN9702_c0_g1~~TRINITY_DN9702_c0_g1_i1.p1  ORF type:complete len:422 (-),score=69.27 TRINITY_DN9702_c0_g1_i1:113-1378(-)
MHTYKSKSKYSMIPIPEALEIVLKNTNVPQVENVPLSESLGRTVSIDVTAKEPLPPFRASIKDGYAVIAEDGEGEFPVVAEITAGVVSDFTLQPKTVCRITTGSPVPNGADAVVMVEDTVLLDRKSDGTGKVKILKAVTKGRDIRPIGSDITVGAVVLAKGEIIGPAEIGLLATVGVTSVPVYSIPKVAILSTGDELVEPEQIPGPGKIRDSNRSMLISLVNSLGLGIKVLDLGIARDTPGELEAKLNEGFDKADVLISSGGVSMGDLDLIQPLLEKMGKVHFGLVLMKPGKPLTFATLEHNGKHKLAFGLPGNPVSSYVTFCLAVNPCLKKISGFTNPYLTQVYAKLTRDVKLDPERPEYHRATLKWDSDQNCFIARSTGEQTSSRLLSMRSANALCILPQKSGVLPSGTLVPAVLIGPL